MFCSRQSGKVWLCSSCLRLSGREQELRPGLKPLRDGRERCSCKAFSATAAQQMRGSAMNRNCAQVWKTLCDGWSFI